MSIAARTLSSSTRPAVVAVAALVMTWAAAGAARADCSADFAALMSKRISEINALNQISKANKGKLDPVAACPRLRNLAAAEGEVVSYMAKNKDWCNLPDEIVTKMGATHAKTVGYAAKACSFAVKIKQMQQQAQKQAAQAAQAPQQQAIKLPTGPL